MKPSCRSLYKTAFTWRPLLVAFCATQVAAADQFGPGRKIAAFHDGANSVSAADLDGDGDEDLVATSRQEDGIAWYENTDGLGSFGPKQIITTLAVSVESVVTADMDGDGDQDVLSASFGDDKIAWYENTDGLGNFGPQRVITILANGAVSVFAADLDGDGDQDVLSASSDDNKIAWYENTDGLGNFGPQRVLTTQAEDVVAVLAADVDGDGDEDVFWCSSKLDSSGPSAVFVNRIEWHENVDGMGTFGMDHPFDNLLTSYGVTSFDAADLENDGDLDLIVFWMKLGALRSSRVVWYRNFDGLGNYGDPKLIGSGQGSGAAVYASDLDDDGDQDILAAFPGTVAWFENINDSDTFSSQPLISVSVNGTESVIAADLDGDGSGDVITVSAFDDKLAWHKNTDGLGAFGSQRVVSAGVPPNYYPLTAFASDLDGDGDLDMLAAWTGAKRLTWYENTDGLGNYGPENIIVTGLNLVRTVTAADLDGDGDQDVLTVFDTTSLNSRVVWYKNLNGAGSFGVQKIITKAANAPTDVFTADLDGDGDLDVLSTSAWDNKTAWYENTNGLGNFGPLQIISIAADDPAAVIAADLDGDGDLDVLSASTGDDKVAWYKNTNGLANFEPQIVITTAADGAVSVFAADLDDDGDLDVLSASLFDDKVAWYENSDGAGAFGSEQVITTAADNVTEVYAADLDGDGDWDVLSASAYGDKIAWYENTDGVGTFGPEQLIAFNYDGAISVLAADLDGDGDLDVVASAFYDHEILWYENSCNGALPSAQIVREGAPPNPVAFLAGVMNGPSLGVLWDPVLDHSTFQPDAILDFVTIALAPANIRSVYGTILCASPPLRLFTRAAGVPFAIPIPNDCTLVGVSLCSQGGSINAASALELANALDLTIGTF